MPALLWVTIKVPTVLITEFGFTPVKLPIVCSKPFLIFKNAMFFEPVKETAPEVAKALSTPI